MDNENTEVVQTATEHQDIIDGFNEFSKHIFSIPLLVHRKALKKAIKASNLAEENKKYILHQMWLAWQLGFWYSRKGIEKIRTKLNELLNLNL